MTKIDEHVDKKVNRVSKEEVRKAMKRMKNGKAVGPDDIPVEAWQCLREKGLNFLASLFNEILEKEELLEEWRSVMIPVFKNKGGVQSCSIKI